MKLKVKNKLKNKNKKCNPYKNGPAEWKTVDYSSPNQNPVRSRINSNINVQSHARMNNNLQIFDTNQGINSGLGYVDNKVYLDQPSTSYYLGNHIGI